MAGESSSSPTRAAPRGAADSSGYMTLLEIAQGGMGTVELAVRRGEHFSRLFAIKRLHRHYARSDEARGAFLEEGRVAALLRHPNTVGVVEVDEDARGPYLVMQYVEGAPVSDLIAQAKERGELLPIQICVRACLQAALGLHAAHQLVDHVGRPQGFLHRDVSPQNILVGFDGMARVTDFGVAQAMYADELTPSRALEGKLRYMAPERLRFDPVDARSDLFSLGVVLHEMLSGERLFVADSETDIAEKVLNEPTPDIGLLREGVPLNLVELLFELLAKKPEFRPATAAEVAERLDAMLTGMEFDRGKISTADYMEEHFAAQRARTQARIREALDNTLAGFRRKACASEPPPDADRRPMRRGLRIVVGMLALGALVSLAWGSIELRAAAESTPEPQASGSPADGAVGSNADSWRGGAATATPSGEAPAVGSAKPRLDRAADVDAGQAAAKAPAPRRRITKPRPRRPAGREPTKPDAPCAEPFYYDAQGRKRVRRECF
jgi:serine/threonine-protein kinase